MKKSKAYLQCGYEDYDCKSKDCMKCRRRFEFDQKKFKKFKLNHAEMIVIEDFATIDLYGLIDTIRTLMASDSKQEKKWGKEKMEELELMQNVMRKLMFKLFNCEKINEKEKKLIKLLRK